MAHKRVELEPGEALYLEGEEADTAFIIRKGKVEVELLHGRLEGLDDVRCVGFEAMLSCNWYQETVRAKETVVAYCISSQDIVDLFARDKDLLEQRELVAEQVYRQVGTKLVYLRWTLLSQDLLARTYEEQSNSARRFVGENLMETAFASNTGNPFGTSDSEEDSKPGELGERFLGMLRSQRSAGTSGDTSPVPSLNRHASSPPPSYARPPMCLMAEGRDGASPSGPASRRCP